MTAQKLEEARKKSLKELEEALKKSLEGASKSQFDFDEQSEKAKETSNYSQTSDKNDIKISEEQQQEQQQTIQPN